MPQANRDKLVYFAPVMVASLMLLAYLAVGHPLTALAVLVCVVTLIPIVIGRERIDLFSPWNYMFYYVLLNVLVRYLFIDFEVGQDSSSLTYVFYMNQPQTFLTESMAVMLLGFAFLTIGYLIPPRRTANIGLAFLRSRSFDSSRFNRAITWMLLTAAAAFVTFVFLTFEGGGEFALALLSSHRGLSDDLTQYRAHGYLRLLIGLSSLVTYLTYVRLRLGSAHPQFDRLALAASILIAMAMAFYSQSRAALVFVFLNLIFLKYYIDGRRLPWNMLAAFVPIVLVLFTVTTSLRAGAGFGLSGQVTPMTVVAPIVLNNGGIDASKTGHVIAYADQTQDFKFGATLVQFVWAVVPRQLWVQKPPNLDTFIGERVYGAQTYGSAAVPPGLFAEMYLNYWYVGIVLGAVLLGIVMKVIRNLLAGNGDSPMFLLCYVALLQSFGMSILASGVSSTIMGTLMAGVPLVLVLRYVSVGTSRSRLLVSTVALGGTGPKPLR